MQNKVYEDVESAYERARQSTRQQAFLPLLDTVLATFRQLVATSQQSAETGQSGQTCIG